MTRPDLNLLATLEVLLDELSVARAAQRLGLSPSAMSRTLARLRETTGDPLLVKAGRSLVPTPHAQALMGRVPGLMREVEAALRPAARLDPATLTRDFVLRTSDGFVESFGPALLGRLAAEAPGVRLRFVQKPDKSGAALREGRVDLETGVLDEGLGGDLRVQALFQDHLVGVVRREHALASGAITPARYAAARHVVVSRSGFDQGAVEQPYLPAGLERQVVTAVSGFAAALSLVRLCDLVATVPERHTANLRDDLFTFALPASARPFTVSLLWHPRLDADPAHRWLRGLLRSVCQGG